MREKLIELLKRAKAKEQHDFLFGDIDTAIDMPYGEEYYADHLIANGVTIPVRCQDCKHWKNEINGCTEDKRFCDIGFYMIRKDGFCSHGVRR